MERPGRDKLLAVLTATWLLLTACSGGGLISVPTYTPEPIVPTRTPPAIERPHSVATLTDVSTATVRFTLSPTPPATPMFTATPEPATVGLSTTELSRFGIAGPLENVAAALAAGLPFSTTLNWRTSADPSVPDGVTYWQMLRLTDDGISPPLRSIEAILSAQPGAVWLMGNEPDVPWQDGVTADRYAELYHEAYSFIKERDPSAVIGAGGVSMPSPLRLAYLNDVLHSYESRYGEPMPVDLWSIHAFTLREEVDSWGIGIPPGRPETAGQLFEIDDHGDADIFIQHVGDFRLWLAENGYRSIPLAVTEFGILLPADYGFPEELVANYLRETIEFMRTARSDETGLPSDDNRLVQFWFWYSLYDDGSYPTGNLYDPAIDALTPLGEAYRDYVMTLSDQ